MQFSAWSSLCEQPDKLHSTIEERPKNLLSLIAELVQYHFLEAVNSSWRLDKTQQCFQFLRDLHLSLGEKTAI